MLTGKCLALGIARGPHQTSEYSSLLHFTISPSLLKLHVRPLGHCSRACSPEVPVPGSRGVS